MALQNISIIVAVATDNGIGKENRLLSHIPDDLKRFRKITTGHTVIMGRNTYLSLPGGPLKNRRNIVITDNKGENYKGCEMAHSIQEALEKCDRDKENFIIGGASVYRQFLPYASRLYITRMEKTFEADTYFPQLEPGQWEEISRERVEQDPEVDFSYEYVILERKG